MIRTDQSCQNALNQCLYVLRDAEKYVASQPSFSTKSISNASKSTRVAIDTFAREQRVLELQRKSQRVQAVVDQQKAKLQRQQSIFADIHAQFQSGLIDLKA